MHTRQTVRIIAAAAAGLLAFAVPTALQWEGFVCALVGIMTGLGSWFMLAPEPGSRQSW